MKKRLINLRLESPLLDMPNAAYRECAPRQPRLFPRDLSPQAASHRRYAAMMEASDDDDRTVDRARAAGPAADA
jgi:hypothetical protein